MPTKNKKCLWLVLNEPVTESQIINEAFLIHIYASSLILYVSTPSIDKKRALSLLIVSTHCFSMITEVLIALK